MDGLFFPANEAQCTDDRGHPVGGRLLPGGEDVGGIRRAQHGHVHLGTTEEIRAVLFPSQHGLPAGPDAKKPKTE